SFDIRTVPDQSFDQILDEIEECLHDLKQIDSEIKANVKVLRLTNPAEISEKERIVQMARDATTYVTGKEPKIAGIPGATDARFLINQAGIPTIVDFGPGKLDQCHVANEHIEIDQVVDAAKIYALIVLKACGYQ
ncbi:MAG: M20/M25/M40 family metallo-hydrolase, partial [Candidatus Bathyarchaeota archaeon]